MDEIHNSKIENSLVSVVILNYNDVNHIEKCLDSVFGTTGCKFEVILIDNGSTDARAVYNSAMSVVFDYDVKKMASSVYETQLPDLTSALFSV